MPAITFISSVPPFSSPAEHQALIGSTPASFNDIPPVLRHREEGLSITFEPPLEGNPTAESTDWTLYVLESVVVFMAASGQGFQLEYPAITLHAISRSGSSPSIYFQLDEHVGQAADDDACDMRELIIVPRNESSLEPIFDALSQCSSLHADKADPNDDGSDLEFPVDGDDLELSDAGRAALDRLESLIPDFDD